MRNRVIDVFIHVEYEEFKRGHMDCQNAWNKLKKVI